MALKRRRQVILQKKNLRKDMAKFLVDFWILNTPDPLKTLTEYMHEGHRGYDKLRGRELIGCFEHLVTQLRDPKRGIGFWKANYSGYRDAVRDDENAKLREKFIMESDSLMSRLMEITFDLDFEE